MSASPTSTASAAGERPENIVVLSNVSKDYSSGAGVVRAMREVDLTIARGEFVAIVGTSGSGKSTMMNILGCLDRPTRGTYELASLEVGNRSNDGRALVRNRLIGFIFQGFNLLPRTTALENVELPLQYRGVASAQRRKRAIEALEQVGLGERMHHTPNQLSGGQQQRVAIARALVTDPPLLLADEPTGNLDTRTSLEVLALLQKLNTELGVTICLVTHEHDIAACASRVITMRDGRIVSDVRQERAVDAAAALEALPVAETNIAAGPTSENLNPRERLRLLLGGPVPFVVYAAMAAGAIGGALLGMIYDELVLGQRVTWIPMVLAVLGEALVGARYGARRVGHPLTVDQRARVAIGFTCAVTVPIVALGSWFALPWSVVERVMQLSSPGIAVTLAVGIAAVLAIALLRYLLLALFTPRRAAAPHA
jgi:putative ABC transport system ATP-binding protein